MIKIKPILSEIKLTKSLVLNDKGREVLKNYYNLYNLLKYFDIDVRNIEDIDGNDEFRNGWDLSIIMENFSLNDGDTEDEFINNKTFKEKIEEYVFNELRYDKTDEDDKEDGYTFMEYLIKSYFK